MDSELARRLAAAYVSWHFGITPRSAYERYLKDREPGEYWLQLAANVEQQSTEILDVGMRA